MMPEREQDPGADDVEPDDDRETEGPQEIIDAAFDELDNPADESDEG